MVASPGKSLVVGAANLSLVVLDLGLVTSSQTCPCAEKVAQEVPMANPSACSSGEIRRSHICLSI